MKLPELWQASFDGKEVAFAPMPAREETKKLPAYLVFDIGCIHCGEESRIVGFTDDADEAAMMAKEASIEQRATWEGQHSFEVFPTVGFAVGEETRR